MREGGGSAVDFCGFSAPDGRGCGLGSCFLGQPIIRQSEHKAVPRILSRCLVPAGMGQLEQP